MLTYDTLNQDFSHQMHKGFTKKWNTVANKVHSFFRKNKRILLVHINQENIQIAEWDFTDNCLWQESIDLEPYSIDENNVFTNERDALRRVLLQHEVAENVDVIFILDDAYLHKESLIQPALSCQEQKEAMQWEAQHCLPWDLSDCVYAYTFENISSTSDGDNDLVGRVQVTLYGLNSRTVNLISETCDDLLLNLISITTAIDLEQVANFWYKGLTFHSSVEVFSENEKYRWSKILQLWPQHQIAGVDLKKSCDFNMKVQKRVNLLSMCCLLCSCVLCLGSFGMRYLAQQSMVDQKLLMQRNVIWQKRYEDTLQQDQRLKETQEKLKRIKKNQIVWHEQLEYVAKALPPGVWLTSIQQNTTIRSVSRNREQEVINKRKLTTSEKTKQKNTVPLDKQSISIYGRAWDVSVIQMAVSNLQRAGHWNSVQLVRTTASSSENMLDYEIKLTI